MTRWMPERDTLRMRNGTVVSVAGRLATVRIDGTPISNVPVYGPAPAVNAKVLVLEQGGSLLILGNAVSLVERIERLEGEHG